MKKRIFAAFAILLAASLFTSQFPLLAQDGQQASQSAANGLNTVTFDLAAGKLKVYLPGDIRPGDTISGTVSAEPRGSTDTERAANQGVLNGLVIDLDGEKQFSAGQKNFTWTLNSPSMKRQLRVISEQRAQKPLATAKLTLSQTAVAAPADFNLPPLGQAGRPMEIIGPFDGNAANTTCSIAGQPVPIIAESPRRAVFMNPAGSTGLTEITVGEAAKQRTVGYRSVGVNLTAPKTDLIKGEKTTVAVKVSGLEGIQSNIPLQLMTTGSANMSGGNMQTIEIRPTDVGSAGNFMRTFDLTGVQTGGFTVTGTILVDPVAGTSCKCVCELGKTPIVTAGTSKIDGGGMQHAFKANVAKAACNGSKCSIEKTEYSWSIGAGSTATYTVTGAKQDGETLKLDVTGAGTVVLTVTVTITCSDGTKCSASGTKTFTVEAK